MYGELRVGWGWGGGEGERERENGMLTLSEPSWRRREKREKLFYVFFM